MAFEDLYKGLYL
jgi:hypothetical protein